jgi:hypothetical protein
LPTVVKCALRFGHAGPPVLIRPGRHLSHCLSGRLVVRMVETGAETPITMGDLFEILFEPPEHTYTG